MISRDHHAGIRRDHHAGVYQVADSRDTSTEQVTARIQRKVLAEQSKTKLSQDCRHSQPFDQCTRRVYISAQRGVS